MRVPNPRLLRLGGLTRGAIMEPGDGELIISPLVQPVMELTSPIDTVYGVASIAPSPLDDSAHKSERVAIVGASPGSVTTIFSFAKGMWALDIAFDAQWNPAAASNAVGNNTGVRLTDPGLNISSIFEIAHMVGTQAVHQWGKYLFTFQRDNFTLSLVAGATLLGDILYAQCSCNARRIL